MAYTPVAQRTGTTAASRGYVPVAARAAVNTSPGLQGETAFSIVPPIAPAVRTTTQAIPDATTGGGIGGFLKDTAQATLRDLVAAGIAVGNTIKKSTVGATLDPKNLGVLGPALLGKEPIKGLADTAAEYQASLEKTPFKAGATPLAILGSVAPTALDFLGLGGETKGASALFKALKNTEAGVEGEAHVLGILKGVGFTDDIAKQYARILTESKDLDYIKQAVMSAKKLQETTKSAAYVPLAERAKAVAETTPGVRVAETAVPTEIKVVRQLSSEEKDMLSKVKGYDLENIRVEKKVYPTVGGRSGGTAYRIIGDYPVGSRYRTAQETTSQIASFKTLGEAQRTLDRIGGIDTTKAASARVNTKLEKMAAESPTFGEFYNKSGVTLEALNATAKNKGYENAADFYAKNSSRAPAAAAADTSEMASLEHAAQGARDDLPELPRLSMARLTEETASAKQALEDARLQRDIGRETVPDMPGASVRQYESRAFPGELPEVKPQTAAERLNDMGKALKDTRGKFEKRGDQIVADLGFADVDEANQALKDYKAARQQLKAAEASVSARVKDYRDRKAVYDEVVRFVKEEGQARREKVKLVQDFFKLSDAEVAALLKGERDLRLMSDGEFDDFLKRFEGKSTEAYLRMQDLVDLKATIFDKEFVKLDNLRQAMKLPTIENMTPEQMRQFNMALKEFEVGDEFLGVRQLETVAHTDLNGIHTRREARARLLMDINAQRARKGLPPTTLDELSQIKVGWLDKYRYDVALARQNPLYELMVHDTHKALLNADLSVLEVKEKVNELFTAARQSRDRSVLSKLIPTDERIFAWLEAPDAQKILLAKEMTHEELEAAMYVRAWYAEARDYLIQQNTLKRYISDYITHIRRGFLEGWYESSKSFKPSVSGEKGPGAISRAGSGLKAAFQEAFSAYKQEEAFFNILNEKTGDVLPLEKFFQFSLKRTGELIPTKNAARAFLRYVATFEKKKALDSLIPKLDIYVHSLTPKKLTPRGLEFDDSLKRFFKQWMNTKKGRPTDLGFLKPGDKLDWAMRTGVALTRFLDLGLSIPVGIASNLGAQASVYRGLGAKAYALGSARLATKEGRAILSKYKNLVGESVREKITSADSTLGENLMNGVFGLFSFADRKARGTFLLGSLTPAELASGRIAPDRLADIALDLGRHLPMENMQSVIGKTALGKVGTQYKTWAVPLLSSTLDDLSKLQAAVRAGDPAFLKSKEFAELLRTTVLSGVVGLGAYGILSDKTPMKQRSFTDKMAVKAAQDALSLVGALDPSFWTTTPRLAQFVNDFFTAIKQVVMIEKNKNGELTGANKLESLITPGVVRQVIPPTPEASTHGGGLPGLPKLPKIEGGLPKLPKLK